jgi:hypothetical protein
VLAVTARCIGRGPDDVDADHATNAEPCQFLSDHAILSLLR